SLAAALNDDRAGYDALGQLQALQARRVLLQNALAEAERIEAVRLAGLRSKEAKAKSRALAQHQGRLMRDAAEVTAALVQLRDARNRLTATAAAIGTAAAGTPR